MTDSNRIVMHDLSSTKLEEICHWCQEMSPWNWEYYNSYDISPANTLVRANIFRFYDDELAMAFKLAWC